MSEAQVHYWTASDGIQLAWHELGDGQPVVLLHGLFSDANMNWIKFGTADRIAREGFRVIMPDHRAHGLSGKPHGAEYYPNGILARDVREQGALDRIDPLVAEFGQGRGCRRPGVLAGVHVLSFTTVRSWLRIRERRLRTTPCVTPSSSAAAR